MNPTVVHAGTPFNGVPTVFCAFPVHNIATPRHPGDNVRMHRTMFLLSCIAGAVILGACSRAPAAFPVPVGEQTMTGVLVQTNIGLLKRGTHLLKTMPSATSLPSGERPIEDPERSRRSEGFNDGNILLESATANLSAFENRAVSVQGVFEQNSDPALPPVLVVSRVTPVQEETQAIRIPSLDLSCAIPAGWTHAQEGTATRIYTEEITGEPLITLTADASITALPQGTPFMIDGHHAIRSADITAGSERVTIDAGTRFIVLRFRPPPVQDQVLLRAQWLTFLTSIRFTGDSAASVPSAGSGAVSGVPCGGTAGILCPAGEYCAITDRVENIGKCTAW